ncbi:MAG: MBL fold metallo-hydrolase [Planctomycetota bacterium]
MLPKPPARQPQLGFIYAPPYRIEGVSIAGEASVVYVPELDLAFDIGACPKAVLAAERVALTHAHMDHIAAIAYYYSQRQFQGMGPGKVLCPAHLVDPIHRLMEAWRELEQQQTPYELEALEPGRDAPLKGNLVLRSFETDHRVPSQGYVAMEMRSKLKPEFAGLPQEELVRIKSGGQDITQIIEAPQVCYTGDTCMGPHFERPDVLGAKVLITECTFIERGHRRRAKVGKHLHLDDVIEVLERSTAETVILTHLSRRTHLGAARKAVDQAVPARHRDRVVLLMDSRGNRERYERQLAEAEAAAGSVGGAEG